MNTCWIPGDYWMYMYSYWIRMRYSKIIFTHVSVLRDPWERGEICVFDSHSVVLGIITYVYVYWIPKSGLKTKERAYILSCWDGNIRTIKSYEVGVLLTIQEHRERIKVTQKWLKSESTGPSPDWAQVTQKWLRNDSNMGSGVAFESLLGHFGVGLPESLLSHFWVTLIGWGEKTPTPKISALLRKRPVLVRANFVLTKDRKRPYYRHFCGKCTGRGLVVKRPGVLSKVQLLNLVLWVGVFSLLPI